MATVTKFTDFSVDQINFSEVHKNKLGGKAIYLTGKNSQKLQLQLPPARAPFGLSPFEDKATKKVTYTIPLSLDDESLKQFFIDLDAKILDHVANNSEEILGKKMSLEVLTELYTPLAKYGKDPAYAPQLKLKVQQGRNGDFVPKAYDMKRNPIPLDEIEKQDTIHTIVDINQIWVVDKKFGVSVRLEQVMKVPSTKLSECAFSVSDAEEEIDVPAFVDSD
jgi:hypothetical protein